MASLTAIWTSQAPFYEYKVTGPDPITTIVTSGITSNTTITINGLIDNESYSFWLRGVFPNNFYSAWSIMSGVTCTVDCVISGTAVPVIVLCGLAGTADLVSSVPIITLLGASTITLQQNQTYVEHGATATDSIDGNITGSIIISGTVNTSISGTYYIHYNVVNSLGTPAVEVIRTVIIIPILNTIVELFGAAGYGNPVGYSTVYLSEVRGYDEAELVSLGVAMGSTSSLSSLHIDAGYTVTLYTGVGYTGDSLSLTSTSLHLENLSYYPLPPGTDPLLTFNDKTRSLVISVT